MTELLRNRCEGFPKFMYFRTFFSACLYVVKSLLWLDRIRWNFPYPFFCLSACCDIFSWLDRIWWDFYIRGKNPAYFKYDIRIYVVDPQTRQLLISIPQCTILEFPNLLSQWQHDIRLWLSISVNLTLGLHGRIVACTPYYVFLLRYHMTHI